MKCKQPRLGPDFGLVLVTVTNTITLKKKKKKKKKKSIDQSSTCQIYYIYLA